MAIETIVLAVGSSDRDRVDELASTTADVAGILLIVNHPVAMTWFATDLSETSGVLRVVLSGLAAMLAASGTRYVPEARRGD